MRWPFLKLIVFTRQPRRAATAKAARHAPSGWCGWMALNSCAASCCTSCPAGSSVFATMGCWPVAAKGSSCALRAWLYRCQCPTLWPLSRPRRSWRESPGSMCCCARFADKAVCTLQRCWRARGACQRPLARCCLRARGHLERQAGCGQSAGVCGAL